MIDYLITEDGTIVKGHYLGKHAEDFTQASRETLNVIKDCPEIGKEVHILVSQKITEIKEKINIEKQEVLDWYEKNWTSANEWKKEKQIKLSSIIKPGFKEYELIKYQEVERILRPRSNKSVSSSRWVDPLLVEKANRVPIDTLLKFDKSDNHSCLWHTEKTASLSYHRKGNFVKCFGLCGTVHGAIDVYMKINNCDFVTAVKNLNHE